MRRRTTRLDRVVVAGFVVASAVLAAWFVLGAVPTASAAATHSFEGSCAGSGNARLTPPMGLVPQWSKFEYEGQGVCQGTLDGQTIPQRGAPVRVVSSGPKIESCEGGYDPGMIWAITFYPGEPRSVTIVGTAEVVDAARGQYIVLRGQRSGVAIAVNTLQGHMETVQRCVEGTVGEGSTSVQLDTLTPLVSDDSGSSAASGSPVAAASPVHGPTPRATIRVSVQPRRVTACKRTRLRVQAARVAEGRSAPLPGATVRLGRRSARTDARGRATLVTRLCRPGRYAVVARASGGALGATSVRVVPAARR